MLNSLYKCVVSFLFCWGSLWGTVYWNSFGPCCYGGTMANCLQGAANVTLVLLPIFWDPNITVNSIDVADLIFLLIWADLLLGQSYTSWLYNKAKTIWITRSTTIGDLYGRFLLDVVRYKKDVLSSSMTKSKLHFGPRVCWKLTMQMSCYETNETKAIC